MAKEKLAVVEKNKSIVEYLGLTKTFDITDEADGVDVILPTIQIISQAQVFKFPDGSKRDSFEGVILDISRYNIYWKTAFSSGAGVPPTCFSKDGIRPDPLSEEIQAPKCAKCPQNVYGSDINGGRGKACQNRKNLYILLKNELLPHKLAISPANIKDIDMFISSNILSKGISRLQVVVGFSLEATKNKDGIGYSKIIYHVNNVFEDEQSYKFVKGIRNGWLPVMRGQSIETEAEE